MHYQKTRRQRIKSSRFVTCIIDFNDVENQNWWYTNKGWKKLNSSGSKRFDLATDDIIWYSSGTEVKSVKAFRRKLRKWSGMLPKGCVLRLVSHFEGYDVVGVIK
jgi:hypothetical protein